MGPPVFCFKVNGSLAACYSSSPFCFLFSHIVRWLGIGPVVGGEKISFSVPRNHLNSPVGLELEVEFAGESPDREEQTKEPLETPRYLLQGRLDSQAEEHNPGCCSWLQACSEGSLAEPEPPVGTA